MPIIYLEHPVHGTKVATMDQEAEFDEQHGWSRYNPDALLDTEEVASAIEATPVVRRGRRKKTEDSVETPTLNALAPAD